MSGKSFLEPSLLPRESSNRKSFLDTRESFSRKSFIDPLLSTPQTIRDSFAGGGELIEATTTAIANVGQMNFATFISFLLFAILVGFELGNVVDLMLIFAVIAIIMVISVILIAYYQGSPEKNEQTGEVYTNEKRRDLINEYIDEMFNEIDYNLIIIFMGNFFFYI